MRYSQENFSKGVLVLEDQTYFYGNCFPNISSPSGEICFNTAMTGYQEVISDPSYAGQIVVFSFPHIGNVGTNPDDDEASKVSLKGIIMGTLPTDPSSFRATNSLAEYIVRHQIVSLFNVDTRTIIKKIARSKVPLKGLIQPIDDYLNREQIQQLAIRASKAQALSGSNLTSQLSSRQFPSIKNSICALSSEKERTCKIGVIDFGIKENILKCLVTRGVRCKIFPHNVNIRELEKEEVDGIILSNGPGDPRAIPTETQETIKALLHENIPTLGICLGYQLLAFISGAQIKQLKSGHHGINHPVKNLSTHQVTITSQNHEFFVEEGTLPPNIIPTHRSLFDGTLEGFSIVNKPILAVQFHPEASPGPHDTKSIFDQFITMVNNYAKKS